MSEKSKPVNFNTIVLFIVLGVLGWAGATLQSVSRKVDVLEVQFNDHKQNEEERWQAMKAATARCDAALASIQMDFSRLRRTAPPKQTP